MFNVSGPEILIILVVALIVLGPDKLPDAARKIGGVMREVRRISSGFQDEVRDALSDVDVPPSRPTPMRVTPTPVDPIPSIDATPTLSGDGAAPPGQATTTAGSQGRPEPGAGVVPEAGLVAEDDGRAAGSSAA